MNSCGDSDRWSYSVLHTVEGYLRLVVLWELAGKKGRQWRGCIPSAMRDGAKAVRDQELAAGVTELVEGDLAYLTLSELRDLLLDKVRALEALRRWPAEDILRAEFKKLVMVRNKLAHFRSASAYEAELVRRFAQDLCRWTQEYEQQRERYEFSSARVARRLEKVGWLGITPQLESLGTRAMSAGGKLELGYLSDVWVVRCETGRGSLRGSAVRHFLRSVKDLVVCRVAPNADLVDIVLSKSIEEDDVLGCLNAAAEVVEDPVPFLSAELTNETYEVRTSETIIVNKLPLPHSFADSLQSAGVSL